MHGPTCIFWANLTPFSLKGIVAPNTMGERYNLQRVLNQLRYTGILDTVRVRSSGFAVRKPFAEFLQEYIKPGVNLLPEDTQTRFQKDIRFQDLPSDGPPFSGPTS